MNPELLCDAAHRSSQSQAAEPRLADRGLPEDAAKNTCPEIPFLRELESSILASNQALLARDLPGIERLNYEQAGLLQSLDVFLSASPQTRNPELAAALNAAAKRVLQLTRIQQALLARAQRWLIILTNLSAGTGASYRPPSHPRAPSAAGPYGKSVGAERAKESEPCRA